MPPDLDIRVHTTDEPGACERDEAAPRRAFPDCAEPLTAWRVDLAVLVGVPDHTAMSA
jgi:hypothetical protein